MDSPAPVHQQGNVTPAVRQPTANMDAVPDIPELLENILLNLPIRDLLLAQRVNKTFQATILGSSKLQQALFLKPLAGKFLYYQPPPRAPLLWLESPEDPMHHTVHGNPFFYHVYGDVTSAKDSPASPKSDAIQRPEASWRRMLVSQPLIITPTPRKVFEVMDSSNSFNDCEHVKG